MGVLTLSGRASESARSSWDAKTDCSWASRSRVRSGSPFARALIATIARRGAAVSGLAGRPQGLVTFVTLGRHRRPPHSAGFRRTDRHRAASGDLSTLGPASLRLEGQLPCRAPRSLAFVTTVLPEQEVVAMTRNARMITGKRMLQFNANRGPVAPTRYFEVPFVRSNLLEGYVEGPIGWSVLRALRHDGEALNHGGLLETRGEAGISGARTSHPLHRG